MSTVVIGGTQFDEARSIQVNDRIDGSDAAFEITLSESIDPLIFQRPSRVEIYSVFDDVQKLVFDGFLAQVSEDGRVLHVACVDGKRFLEESMLQGDFSPGSGDVVAHAEAVLAIVRANGYYAPVLDADIARSADVSYRAGMHVRAILDDLFEEFEWVVRQDTIIAREKIGDDLRESVLISSDERTALADILGITNVIVGTDRENNTYVDRSQQSVEAYGYAMGDTVRVVGKTGTAFQEHILSVLNDRKTARTLWSTEKVLATPLYVRAGDTVSVDLTGSVINEAPSELRIAEVRYDFDRNIQSLLLSTDATSLKNRDQLLKDVREKVRILNL